MKTVSGAIVTVMNVSYLLGIDSRAVRFLTEFSVRHKNRCVRDFHLQEAAVCSPHLESIAVVILHNDKDETLGTLLCMEIYVKIIKCIQESWCW